MQFVYKSLIFLLIDDETVSMTPAHKTTIYTLYANLYTNSYFLLKVYDATVSVTSLQPVRKITF